MSKIHCRYCDNVIDGKIAFRVSNGNLVPEPSTSNLREETLTGAVRDKFDFCSLDCLIEWIREQ